MAKKAKRDEKVVSAEISFYAEDIVMANNHEDFELMFAEQMGYDEYLFNVRYKPIKINDDGSIVFTVTGVVSDDYVAEE